MNASVKFLNPFAALIGIPWRSGGRTRAGADCWGIVMLGARDGFGVELPDYAGYDDANDLADTARYFEERANWWRVPDGHEVPGDVLVLRIAGVPAHAALVLPHAMMLHSLAGRNSCIERYDGPLWRQRIEGAYRWLPR